MTNDILEWLRNFVPGRDLTTFALCTTIIAAVCVADRKWK